MDSSHHHLSEASWTFVWKKNPDQVTWIRQTLCCVRDREMKTKAKLYADKKRHAEYSGLVPGDGVLQKQEKQTSFRHHLHQNRMTLLAGMAAAFLSSLVGVFS